MRRFLIALFMTCVVASLQAITINWQVYASEFTWDANSTAYLVYSQSGDLTAEQVGTGEYDGYKIGASGTTTSVTAVGTPTVSSEGVNADFSSFGKNAAEGTKSYVSLTLDGTGFGSGYFYLVVFNTKEGDSEYGDYAVSKAVQYTAGTSGATDGIYDTAVDGETPEIGTFVEIPWMGGTWTSALVPEPTALALLALGVAGLALRRKI